MTSAESVETVTDQTKTSEAHELGLLLCDAIQSDDIELAEALIAAGADCRVEFVELQYDYDGDAHRHTLMPLHLAAAKSIAMVQLLLDKGGVHARETGGDGSAALHCALRREDVVRFLIARGASVTDLGRHGQNFVKSVLERHGDYADLLVEAVRARPHLLDCVPLPQDDDYGLAPRWAEFACSPRPEAVEWLQLLMTRRGFEPDDDFLVSACACAHVDVIALLLRHGLVPTADAMASAAGNSLAAVELLLQHNCEIADGAFCCAVSAGRVDVARRLLALGAGASDKALFRAAIETPAPHLVETLDFLLGLEPAVDVNALDNHGRTPLLAMLDHGSIVAGACERLLAAGADALVLDNEGRSALHHAARRCNTAAMQLFLDRGCDPNALTKSNFTPLMALCTALNFSTANVGAAFDAVRLLVRRGADVNLPHFPKWSPLISALRAGNSASQVVQLLLASGADALDSQELVSVACETGSFKSLCALMSHGVHVGNYILKRDLYNSNVIPDNMLRTKLLLLLLHAEDRVALPAGDPFGLIASARWWMPVGHATFDRRALQEFKGLVCWLLRQKLKLILPRASEVAFALQDLHLPVLLTLLIIDEVCQLAPFVTMFLKWTMVARIKHFK